jgi:N-acetylneuraminic acid mutarotase
MLVVGKMRTKPPVVDEVGAAYDPATNRWRTLPPWHGAPGGLDPLTSDAAVWTGTEMLLWGVTNAAFNPVTNRWRELPEPPTGFGGPSVAVWTGRQMIGWGGGGGDLQLNDGTAYTPATNSWKMLPPAPLSGSGRHTTGVWTGSELIIAGGYEARSRGPRLARDAAAYDPSTNSWRKLAPMPVAADATSAVWNGKEVLLPSGQTMSDIEGQTRLLDRGLAYDPSTDRWRWIEPMDDPRSGAVTIEAGDQLLVWGGITRTDSVPPNGEIYDPTMNSWLPMPRSPLRGRYGAIGVWTGSSLIIWGGQDARTWVRLTDGAAFTPRSG